MDSSTAVNTTNLLHRVSVIPISIAMLGVTTTASAQSFEVFSDDPTVANPGALTLARGALLDDGRQAVTACYVASTGGAANVVLAFRGVVIEDVAWRSDELQATNSTWSSGSMFDEDVEPGLEVSGGEDLLAFGEGGLSVRFFMSTPSGDVDCVRVLLRYPNSPGSATMALEVFDEEDDDVEGWPSSRNIAAIVVGQAGSDIPDAGTYAPTINLGRIRLTHEDVDVEEPIIVLQLRPGETSHTQLHIHHGLDGVDFDGDNGVDLTGTRVVPVTVALDSLRVTASALRLADSGQRTSTGVTASFVAVPAELEPGTRASATVAVSTTSATPGGLYVGELVVFEDNNANERLDANEAWDPVGVELDVIPTNPPDAGTDTGGHDLDSGRPDAVDVDAQSDPTPRSDADDAADHDATEDAPQPDQDSSGPDGATTLPDAEPDVPRDHDSTPDTYLAGGENCLAQVSGSARTPTYLGGFVLLFVLILSARRRKLVVSWLTAGLVTVTSFNTWADGADQFNASGSATRVGLAEDTETLPVGSWAARLDIEHLEDPVVRYQDGVRVGAVVDRRSIARLGGGWAPTSWLEIDVMLPIVLAQATEEDDPLGGAGLLDSRLDARVPLWRPATGSGITATGGVLVPVGSQTGFRSNGNAGGTVGLALAWQLGWVRLISNIAWSYDALETTTSFREHQRARAIAGVIVPVWLLGRVAAEVGASSSLFTPFQDVTTDATEARLTWRYDAPPSGFFAGALASNTLSTGFGVPSWRAGLFVGVTPVEPGATPEPVPIRDRDNDGINDPDDACPTIPEDRDGFEDHDGCPDEDNDKDGIADPMDGAPNAAEDRDGWEDADGVPEPDNDLDGVPDTNDQNPLDPSRP